MGRFNVGDRVLILEGTDAPRIYQGKKGVVESTNEMFFGWVYVVRLDEAPANQPSALANAINEEWLQPSSN